MKRVLTFVLGAMLCAPVVAFAQQTDDPSALRLAEPDFTLVGLPTNLRLPVFGSSFRVTHRFVRPLNDDFGEVLSDLFGIDTGAQIGLEYRFGIVKNGQIGLHRTSDKTIELFAEYNVLRESAGAPLEVSGIFSVDGTNNFRDRYSPALGAIVSRTIADVAAFYVEPVWVNNTSTLLTEPVDKNDTFFIGLGTRLRVRPTVYLVGEFAPRVSGDKPGVNHGSFGIEKRAGGHMFQLNFSNAFGTTMAQIARGGPATNDWYMGFNITRKFY